MKQAVNWAFKSRETGRLTFAQFPNIPLWIWIVFTVLSRLVENGSAHGVTSVIAGVALAVWAVLEIVKGVNPFRRAIGALVLLGLVTSLLRK